MSLYQPSVLNKYLSSLDHKLVDEAYDRYTDYFHNTEIQENIRTAKEEQFQEGFLRELFVKILGYTLNPKPEYNLTTELKNITDSKKCDGAILKNGNALAVIELKGTDTTDLDKVNEQAFNYKNNQIDCVYVITSNFEKLRFYIHDAVEHIEFKLFELSRSDFEILWLCLQKDNLLNNLPEKTKRDSIVAEEAITKKLYTDYADFKNDLWINTTENSKAYDHLTLYKKSQKLIDRFLFILFAEDSGLLPPNTILNEINRWKKLNDLDAYKPLYSVFKQYFGYINEGRKGKTSSDEIFAYNGGLFAPDEVLDTINISDEILLKHLTKLTAYDFNSEIDVNILGHIFENSLNEIELIKAKLQGQNISEEKSKRNKDGVFYTPKYVTKYIVEGSLGVLCNNKKNEIGIIEEDYFKERKVRRKDTLTKFKSKLDEYR